MGDSSHAGTAVPAALQGLSSKFSEQLWVSLCPGPATWARATERLQDMKGNENASG